MLTIKKRLRKYAVLVSVFVLAAQSAIAQRASENAVAEASDGFGTSVGNQRIGIYSSGNVRGFNPTDAGNVRIQGLYFDQVTGLNARIEKSSQIKVGIAAQGYAFPAPTGVVDYTLRIPGEKRELSALAQINTRGTTLIEFDGTGPVIPGRLSLGGGVGYHRDVLADGSAGFEHNEGVLAHWSPNANLDFLPFWSRLDTYDDRVGQVYEPAGDFLPAPNPGRHFFGPDWVLNRRFESNFGLLARYRFLPGWSLRAGIFRSEKKRPKNYFVLMSNLTEQGMGDLSVYSDPPSNWRSTSGEVRLRHSFIEGPREHRLILSIRERKWNAYYGGSASVDLGPAAIGERIKAPEPVFYYSARTRDHVDETTVGLSYQLAWKGLGLLGISVQRPDYRKHTLVPGEPAAVTTAQPWLFNAALSGAITDDISIYGDYTRGLEDSGIAPQNASNRDQAMPAIVTRQTDAGFRWSLTPKVHLVAGAFNIRKPYFNLDPASLYTQLGDIENKGVEFSVSGSVLPGLDVVAGAVLAEPRVVGEAVRLGVTGRHPVGMPAQRFDLNFNWQPPQVSNVLFDLGIRHRSGIPATLDNLVSLPARTTVNGGVRYQFSLSDHPASVRFSVNNLFDSRDWRLISANTYDIHWDSGRRLDVRLIVDL